MIDQKIINAIKSLISDIKKENDIVNEIIRDDVFQILQDYSTVLYYPLDGEEIDGCHLEKTVNAETEQFVFINTVNTRERQAFSAAHELGHMWDVYERVQKLVPGLDMEEEDVINRFAAELMMPEVYFESAIETQLKRMDYKGPKIDSVTLVKLIAFLMNYFFVPFKSVVYRFNEIGRLDPKYDDSVLEYKDSDLLKEIINAEQYTRLGIVNRLKSMDNIQEYLMEAENNGLISEKKAQNIRKEFEIKAVNKTIDLNVEF